jgi:cell filamentation protein
MASKYHLEASHIYLDDSDVPHNKLGIIDSDELHEIERELLEEAYQVFYHELSDTTVFNEAYFKALHHRTFGCLYEWAGKYRSFNMTKGTSRFCQGEFVESSSRKLFAELARDNYLTDVANSRADFVKQLAYFKCELIALHPFCELNGRVTRLFFDMIALFNGYHHIDYSHVTPEIYIKASIDCVQFANSSGMEKIIELGLKR